MPHPEQEKPPSPMPGFAKLIISENVIMNVIPDPEHIFLYTTIEMARALHVSAEGIRTQKCLYRNSLQEGYHYIDNYIVPDPERGIISRCTIYTYKHLVWYSEHIRAGYAWDLRAWAKKGKHDFFNEIKVSHQKQNSITPERMNVLLCDIARIKDEEIRLRLLDNLMDY